ncbi:MAG: N-acetyltransferase family protein [Solirubrobacteraceae bacterium]
MLIRDADPARDALACAHIYEPAVTDGVSSLEEIAPSSTQVRQRIEWVMRGYPWLVAEDDGGAVVGYAYATQHRERAAYRWATDTSVYVAPSHHRRGIGRSLYGALMPLLVRQGYYVACAGITLPNDASVALHESFGFEPVGSYDRVGFKFGRWWAVGWWLAQLREQVDGATPPEPGPPVGLAQSPAVRGVRP